MAKDHLTEPIGDPVLAGAFRMIEDYLEANADPETPVIEYLDPPDLAGRIDLALGPEGVTAAELLPLLESYLRYSLRSGHRQFHKGSALAEVARREEIPVERRLAMGDGHNDLQMLDPAVAGEFACPANAVREVKEAVSQRGGRVATREHSAGVVEVLGLVFGGL